MQLGVEALGAKSVPVHVLLKMKSFLKPAGKPAQYRNPAPALVALPGCLGVFLGFPARRGGGLTVVFRVFPWRCYAGTTPSLITSF